MTEKKIGSSDIDVNPNSGREKDLFLWFLASFLFGKRINQGIARKTYEILTASGLNSPDKIINIGRHNLVKKLDEGGYARYDESTADRLIFNSELLKKEYRGRVTNIFAASKDRSELERRLLEFNGVGPKTVEIFMRDIKNPMSIAPPSKKQAA